MPRLCGLELIEKLRSNHIELPVIMATTALPAGERPQNRRLEPVIILEKPYATGQLLDTVKALLREVFPKPGRPPGAPHQHDSGEFSIERYTASRKGEWDAFVSASRNATFLFTRDYMDYHSDRFTDHSLMIFSGQALVAVLSANLKAGSTLISHEGLTYGGLVVSPPATLCWVLGCFHALLRYLSEAGIHQLLYKRIPAFYGALPDDDVAYALFLLEARLYRRDCSLVISQADPLPIRKERRRLSKKAARLGVRIVEETAFQPFWERVLAPQLAARYGVKPVHTLGEITLLASRFPTHIRQFSAWSGDEILAGATIYETPAVAHVQYSAVTGEGRRVGAQACLFASLIEQYRHKRFFDFGVSSEDEGRALNHGLLGWKEGFGTRCFTLDFYEIATANYPRLESALPSCP